MNKLLTITLIKLFYYIFLVTRNYGTLFVNDFEWNGEYVSYFYNKEETKGRIKLPFINIRGFDETITEFKR